MATEKLHRYTSFSSMVHMLGSQQITLLDPTSWDDRNDSYFLEAYRQKVSAKRVFALCFTEAQQKYHHWSVFAAGDGGVCISFKKTDLINTISKAKKFEFKKVKYISAAKAKRYVPFTEDGLKYTKNIRYSDESEWRMLFTDYEGVIKNPYVKYDINIIERVTISPWLPKPLFSTMKLLINNIHGCKDVDVRRSTLVEYLNWKKIADKSIK